MNHCAIYNTCLYAIIRTEPTQLILTSALFTTMLFILFPRLANFIATLLFMRAAILVGHVLIESTMYSPNPEEHTFQINSLTIIFIIAVYCSMRAFGRAV